MPQPMPQVAQFSLPTVGSNNQQGQQSNQNSQTPDTGGMPPVAQFSLPNSTKTNTTPVSGTGILKSAVNFLFPAVKDIYHDITGQNTGANKKSVLQQIGDTGLTVLPFIPGLGEVGEAARGTEAAVEGGADIAKSSGLLSKAADFIKGSPVAKGALTGYGAGVASNLSQGQGVGQSLMPGLNTIGGAVLGGAAPKVMDALSSFRKTLSGISPEVSLAFQKSFTEKDLPEVEKYINIAKRRAGGEIMPSVENTAADQLDTAAQKIQTATDLAGAKVGEAKQAVGKSPLASIQDVGQSFWKKVQDDYGLNLFTKDDGTIIAKPAEGRNIQVSPADKSRILNIAQQLSDLGTKPSTVGNTTDVLHNINNLVDLSKQDIYGNKNDPLEGLIKYTGGNLNNKIRESAPELASANDRFSNLKNVQGEIRQMAGNKLQRGEQLMKRIFTNNSADSIDLFNTLKNETGIDLQKHAIMAKNAVDSFGGASDKSALEKIITGATQGKEGLLGSAYDVIKGKARQTFANPETVGNNMILNKGINSATKGLITKGAIEAGRAGKGLLGI